MKFYELTYLSSPILTQPDTQGLCEKIVDWIKQEGGTVSEKKNPAPLKFAYPIKKEIEGSLTSIDFYFEPEKIGDLVQKMKSEASVLRSLLFTKRGPREAKISYTPKVRKEEKVTLEEIEKKLDEILGEAR